MTNRLLIDAGLFETRAALIEEGRVTELYIEPADNPSAVGDFFLGRIRKVMPDLAGAFLDLGPAGDGFLLARDLSRGDKKISQLVHEGEKLLLQAIRDPIGEKGIQLSRQYRLDSPHFIFYPEGTTGLRLSKKIRTPETEQRFAKITAALLNEGGVMVRTSATLATDEMLQAEAGFLLREWQQVAGVETSGKKPGRLGKAATPLARILRSFYTLDADILIEQAEGYIEARHLLERVSPEAAAHLQHWKEEVPLFTHFEVEAAIEDACKTRLSLPSGGNIVIERTEAMLVVDVNSADRSPSAGVASPALATNLEAAELIARQVRLRNESGIILIDFIQMNDRDGIRKISRLLQTAFAKDPVPARLIGMTELGLMQITRKRARPPLSALLMAPCPLCEGTGQQEGMHARLSRLLRELAAEVRHAKGGGALQVTAAPTLAAELNLHKGAIETYLARHIEISPEPQMAPGEYKIG